MRILIIFTPAIGRSAVNKSSKSHLTGAQARIMLKEVLYDNNKGQDSNYRWPFLFTLFVKSVTYCELN
jgi:hypothetical protein